MQDAQTEIASLLHGDQGGFESHVLYHYHEEVIMRSPPKKRKALETMQNDARERAAQFGTEGNRQRYVKVTLPRVKWLERDNNHK